MKLLGPINTSFYNVGDKEAWIGVFLLLIDVVSQ